MATRTYRRIRHAPEAHPSTDHWTCAICGTLVPVHGAKRGWITADTLTPPTCSDECMNLSITAIRAGERFVEGWRPTERTP